MQFEAGHSTNGNVMADFCDSPAYKDHPVFSASKMNLEILFYYDDFEVCDVLGSYKKKHKLGELIQYNGAPL